LGDQYVAIRPTRNDLEPFKNGDVAEAQRPFNIQEFLGSSGELIGRLEGTASNLNVVIADVQHLLLNPKMLTNVAVTVGNLRVLSEHALTTVDGINTLVHSNNPAIAQAVSNVVFFSEQINVLAGGLTNLVATNAPVINAAVKNVESSAAVMKDLMADVQAGKGLAGTVLKNDQLATNMSQIANNLSITSSNLNRLGLWGILWKHKPPKANPPPAEPLAAPKDPFAR
ncbi:MAG TPA: hypothetical protein VNT26_04220, partial [Candidatus Sulfotelmatobacter sp.]|nr:hypothetical protein [Candidatus Sulfotelmatobacter sp.]